MGKTRSGFMGELQISQSGKKACKNLSPNSTTALRTYLSCNHTKSKTASTSQRRINDGA